MHLLQFNLMAHWSLTTTSWWAYLLTYRKRCLSSTPTWHGSLRRRNVTLLDHQASLSVSSQWTKERKCSSIPTEYANKWIMLILAALGYLLTPWIRGSQDSLTLSLKREVSKVGHKYPMPRRKRVWGWRQLQMDAFKEKEHMKDEGIGDQLSEMQQIYLMALN